jgi:polar amino acid transport system substrate-binding protein
VKRERAEDGRMSVVFVSRRLAVVAVCAAAAGCAGLPRDPEGTLDRVRGGRLRVGLIEHPPWVVRTSGEPAGVEVDLVCRLAAELGATPEWSWGGEQHLEALERYQLDLVVGGITRDTPWKNRIGLAGPYHEAGSWWKSREYVMAVPPGENGWVRALEEFFDRHRDEVGTLLAREEARP